MDRHDFLLDDGSGTPVVVRVRAIHLKAQDDLVEARGAKGARLDWTHDYPIERVPNPEGPNPDGSINATMVVVDRTLAKGSGEEVVALLFHVEVKDPFETASGFIAIGATSGGVIDATHDQTIEGEKAVPRTAGPSLTPPPTGSGLVDDGRGAPAGAIRVAEAVEASTAAVGRYPFVWQQPTEGGGMASSAKMIYASSADNGCVWVDVRRRSSRSPPPVPPSAGRRAARGRCATER